MCPRFRLVLVLVSLCAAATAQSSAAASSSTSARSYVEDEKQLPDAPSQSKARHQNYRKPHTRPPELTADSPYEPLTNRGKFDLFVRHTSEPGTFASAALNATWLQLNGEPASYGGGMNGWVKRFAVGVADTESRSFFSRFFFPVLLNQDPRFFPKRKGGFFARAWYAGTRVLVTRKDSGEPTFNSSYLLAVAFSKALSTAYYPDSRTLNTTLVRIAGSYGSDAGSFVLEEFWPDAMRLFHKHAPKSVRKIEEKVPDVILPKKGEAQDPGESPQKKGQCKPEEKCKPDEP